MEHIIFTAGVSIAAGYGCGSISLVPACTVSFDVRIDHTLPQPELHPFYNISRAGTKGKLHSLPSCQVDHPQAAVGLPFATARAQQTNAVAGANSLHRTLERNFPSSPSSVCMHLTCGSDCLDLQGNVRLPQWVLIWTSLDHPPIASG